MKYPEMIELHPPLYIYIYPENNDGLEASKVACDMLHATLFEMRSPSRITTPSWPSCTVWSSSAFGGLIINHFSLLPHLTLPEWWESQTRMLRKKKRKSKKLPTSFQFFCCKLPWCKFACQKTSDKFVYKKNGRGSDLGKCNPATGLHKKPTGLCQ